MLVLSRKRDEKITIGRHVRVTVVEIRGDKVRLGVEAPVEVPVHRLEVYEAIKHAAGQAAPRSKLQQLAEQQAWIAKLEASLAQAREKLQAIQSLSI